MTTSLSKKLETANDANGVFSALLALPEVYELTAAELAGALRRPYPNAVVRGWGGSGQPDQSAQGILLSVDGVDLALINQKFVAPQGAFDSGNQPDFYWQDAKLDLKRHRSHMFVIEAAVGAISQSVKRASAVTMVVDTISSLKPLMGVLWESAKNLVRADHFAKQMQGFRNAGQLPIGLWVRLLAVSRTSAGVVCTFGLQFFGSPDIEVHARRLIPPDCLSVALSYAESRLATGKPTWNEATATLEDVATFSIERLANGLFNIGAVAKLTELT